MLKAGFRSRNPGLIMHAQLTHASTLTHTNTAKEFCRKRAEIPHKNPRIPPPTPSTYSALPIKPHKTFISGRLNIPGLGKGGLDGVPPQSPRRNRHWLEITRLSLVQPFALRRWQLALANVASTAASAAGSRTAACANFSLGQWGSVILFWGGGGAVPCRAVGLRS